MDKAAKMELGAKLASRMQINQLPYLQGRQSDFLQAESHELFTPFAVIISVFVENLGKDLQFWIKVTNN